jgi:hypothetical protein
MNDPPKPHGESQRARRRVFFWSASLIVIVGLNWYWRNLENRDEAVLSKLGVEAFTSNDAGEIVSVAFGKPPSDIERSIRQLPRFPQLEWIDLSYSSVTAEGIRELGKLPKLHTVDLSHSVLASDALAALAAIKSLTDLSLSDTAIDDDACESLRQLNSLQFLDLSGCPNVTDLGISKLLELPELRQINLERTNITGEITDTLQRQAPKCNLVFTKSQWSLGRQHWELTRELIDTLRVVAAVLKKVNDVPSAEASLVELRSAVERMNDVKDRTAALGKVPREKNALLNSRLGTELLDVTELMTKELSRISQSPETQAVIDRALRSPDK